MELTVQRRGPFAVATLIGELDIRGYESVAGSLHKMVAQRPRGLVVDLSQVSYVGSIGISLMIQLAQEMRTLCGEFRLTSPQPRVKILLDHVNLKALVPVDKTLEESISNFHNQSVAALAQ